MHVKQGQHRLPCSQTLPTDKAPGKAGPLEIIPPIRRAHAPPVKPTGLGGMWEGSPFILYPHPKNSTPFLFL